jgi:protein-S-isoprenylcysteine O-methyltransferase Ste14
MGIAFRSDRTIAGNRNVNWKTIATIQIVVAALGTAYLAGCCVRQPLTPIRSFGLALALVSFALWIAARIQLGRSFSVAPKATALVTRGIYSRIRNPIYVFSAAWVAGLALALGKPIALLVLLPLIPLQAARAGREARVLEANFGEAYREYCRKTWF